MRWQQPESPNSNELIEQEVFSPSTAAIPPTMQYHGRHRFALSAPEHAPLIKEIELGLILGVLVNFGLILEDS